MARLLVLLLLVLAPARSRAEERPTRATLRRVLELHARSVVEVRGPRRAGPGVIVGAAGQVLTSVEHVSLDAAQVRWAGHKLPADVLMASAPLGVALVSLSGGAAEGYPALPVRVLAREAARGWVVGVVPGRGKRPRPVVGRIRPAARAPFVDVALPLAPGSPVFDSQGRLVAVVVKRRGRAGARALPLEAVKLQLAGAGGM